MSDTKKQGVPKTPVIKLYMVKLGMGERFTFAGILPSVGGLFALKMAEDLRARVTIDRKDYKKFGITENRDSNGNQTGISWPEAVAETKYPFKFTKIEVELLQKSINDLSKNEALSANALPLVDKILGINFTEDESK